MGMREGIPLPGEGAEGAPAADAARRAEMRDLVRRLLGGGNLRTSADPAPGGPRGEARPPDARVYPRDIRRVLLSAPVAPAKGIRARLEDVVPGEVRNAPCGGSAYVIEEALESDDAPALGEAFVRALTDPLSGFNRRLAAEGGPVRLDPHRLLFFDLETTGLGTTPLFLIGTLAWEGRFVVRQYLARTYAEEAAVIAFFLEGARRRDVLVSFNGKAYDLPYVRARAAALGVAFREPADHLDLLLLARRAWRSRLPDCRLQTLETLVCGRVRRGDIPGHLIPDAYHHYVRTGDAAQIAQIVQHNRLDLVTMADLMTRLPARDAGRARPPAALL